VLEPDSLVKIAWDCIILLLLCINLLYIPMLIAFEEGMADLNTGLHLLFDELPSWAFICDVIINFNTATYSKGVITSQRAKIFKHYLRGSFCWDLFIIGPYFLSSLMNVRFLNLILLLRCSKIFKIVSSIEEFLNLR
jgi:Ion transport protein